MKDEEISLIDTHTHIYYAESEAELDAQIQRCRDAGVELLLLPNVDQTSISPLMEAVRRHPRQCLPMMGLHPCSVSADYREQLEVIKQTVDTEKIIGIGEIGLDLYWDKTTIDEQREAFRIQTDWAKNLGLPVSIHCREAYDELFALLDEVQDGRLRGVLHCFTGTLEQARQTIDHGLLLGIGGVVTFKNAGLDRVVAQLSLEHLILETDSPYLAPVPFRGKKNESSYLLYIAKKIADLQQTSLATIADATSANAKRIFGL